MGKCDLLEIADNLVDPTFHLIQLETADVIEHADALPLWSQEYTQLGKGAFSGSIKSIYHNGIQIFSEKMNRVVDQIASAPKDCFVIGLSVAVEGDATWGLIPIKPLSLITLKKNTELYFRTSANSEIIAAVIPISRMKTFATEIEWEGFEEVMSTIKPVEILPGDASSHLLSTLMYGLNTIHQYENSKGMQDRSWEIYEEDLLASCMQALMLASKNVHPFYFDHKIPRYIVNRVRNLTLSRSGLPLGVEEICDSLRIKRRTLNYAFARALGTTPLAYMRNLKLHKVRMDLIAYTNHRVSISETASKWGFVHMSLFSKYYKELFGECPNETLQRVQAKKLS